LKAVITLPTEQDTKDLAHAILPFVAAGDHIFLTGDLGAGKSTFARALIQGKMAKFGYIEDVPSPSFTLVQTYEFEDLDIWHIDLYRLENTELEELGLPEAVEETLMIIEWPDRLNGNLNPAIHIALSFDDAKGRYAEVSWNDPKFSAAIGRFTK